MTPETTPRKVKSVNKRFLFIAAILLAILLVAGIYLFYQKPKTALNAPKTTTNSVVEGYKAQLASLSQAADKDANNPVAHRDYAVALYATGDLNKAYEQYQAAIKLNGNDPVLYNNLGNVARDLGKYDEAIDAYKKSISLNPNSINPYVNLANLYIYTLNKPDLGIEVYKNGLLQNVGNVDLQIQLGVAYEQTKDTDNAAKTYNAILAVNPNNAAALAGLARLKQPAPSANASVKASPTGKPTASPKPSLTPAPKPSAS